MQSLTLSRNDEGRASRAPTWNMNRRREYRSPCTVSRVKFLEEAADCLLAMQCGPDAAERQILWLLFVRRLRRAYSEALR